MSVLCNRPASVIIFSSRCLCSGCTREARTDKIGTGFGVFALDSRIVAVGDDDSGLKILCSEGTGLSTPYQAKLSGSCMFSSGYGHFAIFV